MLLANCAGVRLAFQVSLGLMLSGYRPGLSIWGLTCDSRGIAQLTASCTLPLLHNVSQRPIDVITTCRSLFGPSSARSSIQHFPPLLFGIRYMLLPCFHVGSYGFTVFYSKSLFLNSLGSDLYSGKLLYSWVHAIWRFSPHGSLTIYQAFTKPHRSLYFRLPVVGINYPGSAWDFFGISQACFLGGLRCPLSSQTFTSRPY